MLGLMGLALAPTRGRIWLFGQEVQAQRRKALPRLRRRIGIVFQSDRLLAHQSVLDNVALPLRLAGEQPETIRRHCSELLGWLGLSDRLECLPAVLSSGERQRVAVARAVIGRPDLLLADEPTARQDEAMARRLLYLFEQLNRFGTTVVVAAHSVAVVGDSPHPRLHLEAGTVTEVADALARRGE